MGLLFAFFLIGLPLLAGVGDYLMTTGQLKNDDHGGQDRRLHAALECPRDAGARGERAYDDTRACSGARPDPHGLDPA